MHELTAGHETNLAAIISEGASPSSLDSEFRCGWMIVGLSASATTLELKALHMQANHSAALVQCSQAPGGARVVLLKKSIVQQHGH